MKIRLSVLTRERDTAIKEVADLKQELDTRQAEHRESYAQQAAAPAAPAGAAAGEVEAMNESLRQLEEERAQWQHQAQELGARLQKEQQQQQQRIGTAIPGADADAGGE